MIFKIFLLDIIMGKAIRKRNATRTISEAKNQRQLSLQQRYFNFQIRQLNGKMIKLRVLHREVIQGLPKKDNKLLMKLD